MFHSPNSLLEEKFAPGIFVGSSAKRTQGGEREVERRGRIWGIWRIGGEYAHSSNATNDYIPF